MKQKHPRVVLVKKNHEGYSLAQGLGILVFCVEQNRGTENSNLKKTGKRYSRSSLGLHWVEKSVYCLPSGYSNNLKVYSCNRI